MSVLDTAIRVTAAQPLVRCPRIEGIASLPYYDGSNNGMHGGLLSANAGSTPRISGLGRRGLHDRVAWSVEAGCSRRPRQRRQALRDEHCQVEHAQADRYGEKPSVQL